MYSVKTRSTLQQSQYDELAGFGRTWKTGSQLGVYSNRGFAFVFSEVSIK
jgi:hypothetical protein